MKKVRITLKGMTPLLMHSTRQMNALDPMVIEMKKLTALRGKNKTPEVLQQIADYEFVLSLYWNDGIGLYMPADNIETAIRDAAKAYKLGKDVQKFVMVDDMYCQFDIGSEYTLESLVSDSSHRDVKTVRVMSSRVVRTRPRFDQWSVTCNVLYDESGMTLETLASIIEYAGKYIGLGDYRPKYGKFVASIEELD